VLALALVAIAVWLYRRLRPARLTLEGQLEALRACGLAIEPGLLMGQLEPERESFESEPWESLLYALGTDHGHGAPGETLVADLWHLDTECIEDHGDYAQIARGFSQIAGGALPLTAIRDHVALDRGEAWLSFRLHGRDYRWEARVDDDWLDSTILSRFVALLAEQDSARRIAVYAPENVQDLLLIGTDEAGLACLRRTTGLDLHWLA
jgi:hypothetical protein